MPWGTEWIGKTSDMDGDTTLIQGPSPTLPLPHLLPTAAMTTAAAATQAALISFAPLARVTTSTTSNPGGYRVNYDESALGSSPSQFTRAHHAFQAF